jgi:hypothetical protein
VFESEDVFTDLKLFKNVSIEDNDITRQIQEANNRQKIADKRKRKVRKAKQAKQAQVVPAGKPA